MPIVDSHLHLWDVDRIRYSWYREDGGPASRTYLGSDAAPLITEAGVDAVVLVQGADLAEDTTFLLEQADSHSWVGGVVGWIPLEGARAAESALERLAGESRLCGVRHAIFFEPDPDWMLRADVQEGLGVLAAHRLPFDVGAVLPRHLEHVPVIARRFPALPVVIDHLGRPPIREHTWEPWLSLLRAAAACPNVTAKVSGLMTAADPAGWTIADLAPYVEAAIDVLTPQRLMFGSDWPVCLDAVGYGESLRTVRRVLDGHTDDERAAILGGTAVRVYSLSLRPDAGAEARPPGRID